MNNNSNTFRSNNETLFLVNILNTMYNDNLRQITNLTEMINNLNTSNNQIRTLLVQLLNRSQRRTETRRWETNLNNIDYTSLTNGINLGYLVGEYTIPRNTERQDRQERQNITRNNNNNRYNTFDIYTQNILDNFLQPVEIYPTQSQIEASTRRVRYCDISRPINTSCPISMEEFNDNDTVTVIRHCGHIFHTDNIMNWFRTNCRCPVCRYDIRDYNSNASNQFYNNTPLTNIFDPSNNSPERNNQNASLTEDYINSIATGSLDNLFMNSSIFDSSGNNPTDTLTTFLFNTLNRTRRTR